MAPGDAHHAASILSDEDLELLVERDVASSGRSPQRRTLVFGVACVGLLVLALAACTSSTWTAAPAALGFQQKWEGMGMGNGPLAWAGTEEHGPSGHGPPGHGPPGHGPPGHGRSEDGPPGRAGQGPPGRPNLRGMPIDENDDGEVDAGELAAFSERAMKRFDVTAEIFEEKLAAVDTDGDGKLDKEEVKPLLHELWGAAGPNMSFGADREGMHPWKIAPEAWMHHRSAMQAVKEADEDGNGLLEGAELDKLAKLLKEHHGIGEEGFQQLLGEADASGDGALERKEVPKLLKALREASMKYGEDEDDDADELKDHSDEPQSS